MRVWGPKDNAPARVAARTAPLPALAQHIQKHADEHATAKVQQH